MEMIFSFILIFLAVLAIFDLIVGVSNDAVNFLNSAIGAKVAPFKVILGVAGIGVFLGAIMSNGMMDIARFGIYNPSYFTFYDVLVICLAMMISDVILLNIFNTLGMPTSTTVSMIFDLLGASFILGLIKTYNGTAVVPIGDMLNTSKALQVIIGIFMSVVIAFIFGTVVQWITRLIFTFNYKKTQKYFIAIFGGIALTTISYFMLVKGLSESSFMTPEIKSWIDARSWEIIIYSFVGFTVLVQILHWLKVNIFKIVVLAGTVSLALAFAGNDLVNFIGVPLSGLSAYKDYMANGNGAYDTYLMVANSKSASTEWYYLASAGVVMFLALCFSKKAQNVVKTSISLSRQEEGDEIFGSSGIARALVRVSTSTSSAINKIMPKGLQKWIDKRFDKDSMIMEHGAAFDLIRASINLVLSALLIAFGTSMKLPLSTTYVTFMVAMGSSLSDRAWGRESAVARITGVMSVIGGWFITAGAAFVISGTIATIIYFGGFVAMIIMIVIAISLIFTNKLFNKNKKSEADDEIFIQIISTDDETKIWNLLEKHVKGNQISLLNSLTVDYMKLTDSFMNEDVRKLRKCRSYISSHKREFKSMRRREMVGLRRLKSLDVIEKNMWFHLGSNSCLQVMYALERAGDICLEHVENNFNPMPESYIKEFIPIRNQVIEYTERIIDIISGKNIQDFKSAKSEGKELRKKVKEMRKVQMKRTQSGLKKNFKVAIAYMNILQETSEILNNLRHLLIYTQQLFEDKKFDDSEINEMD